MSSVWGMQQGEGRPRGCIIVQPSPHWGQLPRGGLETDLEVTTCALKWKSKVERARPRDEGWRCDETRGHGHQGVFWLLLPSPSQERHPGFSDSPGDEVSHPCPRGRPCWSQELNLRKRPGTPVGTQKAMPRGGVKGMNGKTQPPVCGPKTAASRLSGSWLDTLRPLSRTTEAESAFEGDSKADQD